MDECLWYELNWWKVFYFGELFVLSFEMWMDLMVMIVVN